MSKTSQIITTKKGEAKHTVAVIDYELTDNSVELTFFNKSASSIKEGTIILNVDRLKEMGVFAGKQFVEEMVNDAVELFWSMIYMHKGIKEIYSHFKENDMLVFQSFKKRGRPPKTGKNLVPKQEYIKNNAPNKHAKFEEKSNKKMYITLDLKARKEILKLAQDMTKEVTRENNKNAIAFLFKCAGEFVEEENNEIAKELFS